MRIALSALFALALTINLKAQHQNVYGPSALKTVPVTQEVPNYQDLPVYDFSVVKIASKAQSLEPVVSHYGQLGSENYRDLDAASKRAPEAPNSLSSFRGNISDFSTPADNTVAVSNGGIILSAINSNFYVSNTEGRVLQFRNFNALRVQYFPLLDGDWYDPKVVYDTDEDRFIMVILHGHTSTDSRVLVFFSKTNNPTEGWNAYELPGDITDDNYWLDYPNIAVNKNRLFISGNMFNDNDNFEESAIINIEKADGYAGRDLDYNVWNGMQTSTGKTFTIVPVQKGNTGKLSDKAYFVATDGGFGDFVMVYSHNTSNNTLTSSSVKIDTYDIPQDSPQKDSGDDVDAGDTRIKTAILIDNYIHFVFTTSTIQGNAAVAYYRYSVVNRTTESAIFHRQGKGRYLFYPSVSQAGTAWDDQTVFILYSECGSDIYPQLGIMSVDENMDATDITLMEGEGYIDKLSDNVERWGDYLSIVKKFNSNTSWAFGCIGNDDEDFDNYLFEVSLDATASTAKITARKPNVEVFPNPTTEYVNVNFDIDSRQVVKIDLYDLQGKLITTLRRDAYNPGTHQLKFNIASLTTGNYLVKITGQDGLLAHQTIVKD